MKRTLEVLLVAATLGIGAYVFHEWRLRREIAARPPLSPALTPGRDVASPNARTPHGVSWVPMAKLSHPPKLQTHRSVRVPPPSAP